MKPYWTYGRGLMGLSASVHEGGRSFGARTSLLHVVGLTLLAAIFRLYLIDAKGLWYDEAATALMARATPGAIIQFHWQAPFEHPPLWVLFMHLWSGVFGQSEAALRLPSALAGLLAVPLLWRTLELAWPRDRTTRLIATGLLAVSPALVLYGQEARMYAIVMVLAVASIYLGMRTVTHAGALPHIGFMLVNWVMVGFHYYTMLLLVAEALFFVPVAVRRRRPGPMLMALAASSVPFLLWAWLAPGFRTTVDTVLQRLTEAGPAPGVFLDRLWRDLTFGAVRWQPRQSAAGYWSLPLFALGLAAALWPGRARRSAESARPVALWGVLFVLIVGVPVLVSLTFSTNLPTRYILFVAPFVYVIIALGVRTLTRIAAPLGVAGLLGAILVALLGLIYYFGAYQKSEYRNMATYLQRHAGPGDAILLEAPRQHLLARYYLPPDLAFSPVPLVPLTDYWPVTAPPVVPEAVDDQLQTAVSQHNDVWLVLAGEDEVDPGQFVQRYLTAISFPRSCSAWLDVRLCRFTAPHAVPADLSMPLEVVYAGEMRVSRAEIALSGTNARSAQKDILVVLHWEALVNPRADYRVTLRLLNREGQIAAQLDSSPIGPLLPTTAWAFGDQKPGYLALPLPKAPATGIYEVAFGVYDTLTPDLLPVSDTADGAPMLLGLASLVVTEEGTMTLYPSASASVGQ